jgi:hypothetical protein
MAAYHMHNIYRGIHARTLPLENFLFKNFSHKHILVRRALRNNPQADGVKLLPHNHIQLIVCLVISVRRDCTMRGAWATRAGAGKMEGLLPRSFRIARILFPDPPTVHLPQASKPVIKTRNGPSEVQSYGAVDKIVCTDQRRANLHAVNVLAKYMP